MRLFVAFEVPQTVREELDRRTRAVRGELPPARWVRPEAMHLTLSFLGETEPARLPALDAGLAAAFAAGGPLRLRAGAIGGFPERGSVRVLWVGLEAEGDVAGLQAEVAAAVEEAAGVPPEGRTYRPHLTLARPRPPWRRPAVERLAVAFGAFDGPLAEPFEVRDGVLFASELRPSGAVYTVQGRYPLDVATAAREVAG